MRISGMTLVEVMLASSVLVIGVFAALSQFATLRQMRTASAEMATARSIVFAIEERFQGARWEALGSSDAPWSLLRAEPGAVTTPANKPLMDDAAVRIQAASEVSTRGLQSLGLTLEPSRLRDLQVYVEYYRAVRPVDADGNVVAGTIGVMDGEGYTALTSSVEFRERFRFEQPWSQLTSTMQAAVGPRRTACMLATTSLPAAQVGEHDPVAIRILAVWKGLDDVQRSFATLTARKR